MFPPFVFHIYAPGRQVTGTRKRTFLSERTLEPPWDDHHQTHGLTVQKHILYKQKHGLIV